MNSLAIWGALCYTLSISKSIIIEPALWMNRPCGGRSNASMVVLIAVDSILPLTLAEIADFYRAQPNTPGDSRPSGVAMICYGPAPDHDRGDMQ